MPLCHRSPRRAERRMRWKAERAAPSLHAGQAGRDHRHGACRVPRMQQIALLPIVAPFLLVVSARSRDIIPSLQLQSDRPARMSQLARESSHDTDEGVQVHESDQNDFYRIDTSGPPARYTGGCSRGRLATCTADQGGLLFLRSQQVKCTL